MRVAVTGGSGLAGRSIVRHLAQHHDVVNIDILDPGSAGVDLSCADYLDTDILDLDGMMCALDGADAVVHAAALPGPAFGSDSDIHRVNVEGTRNVARAAEKVGVRRFVFISSESVLGFAFSESAIAPSYFPVDEAHPLSPSDPYGKSKLAAELLLARQAAGPTVVSLRPPWIWVQEEYEKLRELTRDPSRWSAGLWAYVHGDDLARAAELAATLEIESGFHAAYVAAPDNGTAIPSDRLAADYFPNVPIQGDLPEFGSLLSSDGLDELLGFRPSMSWREFL